MPILFNETYDFSQNCETIKQILTDTAALDAEVEKLKNEIALVTELTRGPIDACPIIEKLQE